MKKIVLLLSVISCAAQAQVPLEAVQQALKTNSAIVFDIREPSEFATTGVAKGAKLLPMSQISQRLSEIPKDPKQKVLLICNTQNRSSAVTKALKERGYSNVEFVNGGMSEWVKRGLETVKP